MGRSKGSPRLKGLKNKAFGRAGRRPRSPAGRQVSENDTARQESDRWQQFLGPSRFGARPCVVAWPSDAASAVPEGAIEELTDGFDGLEARAGMPLFMAAAEIAERLARLVLPHAMPVAEKVALSERAIAFHTWDERGARTVIEAALGIVRQACRGETPVVPLDRLKELTPDQDELPEQTVLRNAAELAGIFAHRLDLLDGSKLLVLGSGSRQRRLLGLLPDATAFSGVLATNKNVACSLLARAGLPVPQGATVSSRDEARALARKLGYPVTLKVATGSRQRGVVPCVVSERALERALDFFSSGKSMKVTVELRLERHVAGGYFRAFVAAGELVACATTPMPVVTGDGKKTIAELVRGSHLWFQQVLEHEDPALAKNAWSIFRHVLVGQDLAPEDVLEKGRTVPVAFPTSEGFAYDVTHKVHPRNEAALVRAARVLGMFWSGIDVQAQRIDVPFEEQDAAILEVNDIPAWAFHACPLEGEGPGVDMPAAIFKAFFQGRRANVPVALVLAGERAALDLAKALRGRGVRTVLALDALEAALDPEADAIVLAPSAREVHAKGLSVPGVDLVLGAVPSEAAATVAHALRVAGGKRVSSPKSALSRMLELA